MNPEGIINARAGSEDRKIQEGDLGEKETMCRNTNGRKEERHA
jgi:hypothetical protein